MPGQPLDSGCMLELEWKGHETGRRQFGWKPRTNIGWDRQFPHPRLQSDLEDADYADKHLVLRITDGN